MRLDAVITDNVTSIKIKIWNVAPSVRAGLAAGQTIVARDAHVVGFKGKACHATLQNSVI